MSSKDHKIAIVRAKKAALRKLEEKRRKDLQETEKAEGWLELLLECETDPDYAQSGEATRKRKNLCIRGIPPYMRGKVWPLLIGKEAKIDEQRFKSLKEKADELRAISGLGVPRDTTISHSLSSSSATVSGETSETRMGLDRMDSLDIGIEKLVLDEKEAIEISNESTGIDQKLVETLVSAHQQHTPPRSQNNKLNETEGIMVQSTASSIDEMMRSGSIDLRASFDLAKNAFPLDAPTPPRKERNATDLDPEFVITPPKPPAPAPAPSGDSNRPSDASSVGTGTGSRPGSMHSSPGTGGGGSGNSSNNNNNNNEEKLCSAELIKWDLPRTLPTLKFFHDGGSLNSDLERVLCAYIIHSPEVGYVQGMSFVVAMLLLYLDDTEALSCFVNLLHRKGIGEFYHLKREALDAYVNCFDYFFEQSLPLLHHHMKREGVSSDMFLLDWHLTLFVKPLPLDAAARVWDVFLGADEMCGMRIALGILRLYAPELSTMNMENLMSFLTRLPDNLQADALLQSVEEIKIPYKKYDKVREREAAKVQGRDPEGREGCFLA